MLTQMHQSLRVKRQLTSLFPSPQSLQIRFKARILNDIFLCPRCNGYFRTAFTTKECLHTFCKSCIYKYFSKSSDCPTCNTYLGPNPFDKVEFDRTLDEIVKKIHPQLYKEDREREEKFYRDRGLPIPSENVTADACLSKAAPETNAEETSSDKPEENKPKPVVYKDQVNFKLMLDESESEDSTWKALRLPYVSTSARVTIMHLKKYLSGKLGIANTNDIEVLYKGEVLGKEHTVQYILRTRQHDPGEEAVFTYRRKRNTLI